MQFDHQIELEKQENLKAFFPLLEDLIPKQEHLDLQKKICGGQILLLTILKAMNQADFRQIIPHERKYLDLFQRQQVLLLDLKRIIGLITFDEPAISKKRLEKLNQLRDLLVQIKVVFYKGLPSNTIDKVMDSCDEDIYFLDSLLNEDKSNPFGKRVYVNLDPLKYIRKISTDYQLNPVILLLASNNKESDSLNEAFPLTAALRNGKRKRSEEETESLMVQQIPAKRSKEEEGMTGFEIRELLIRLEQMIQCHLNAIDLVLFKATPAHKTTIEDTLNHVQECLKLEDENLLGLNIERIKNTISLLEIDIKNVKMKLKFIETKLFSNSNLLNRSRVNQELKLDDETYSEWERNFSSL